MINIKENGRSMIEMIGVLAIVGVLSVGGFAVVNQALSAHRITSFIADTADVARQARKLSCQYEDAYNDKGSYSLFLYKSNAYPENFEYDSTNNRFIGILDSTYKIDGTGKDGFVITVGNLSEELCIKLSTSRWGTIGSSGFESLQINTGSVQDYKDVKSVAAAASECVANNNTVKLSYKGCW